MLRFSVLFMSYSSMSCIESSSTHVSWVLLISFFSFFFEMVNIIDVKISTTKLLQLHPKDRKKEHPGYLYKRFQMTLCTSVFKLILAILASRHFSLTLSPINNSFPRVFVVLLLFPILIISIYRQILGK